MAVEDRLDGDCVPELTGPQIIAEFPERTLQTERAELIRSLPKAIRRRVSALKKLQKDFAYEESRGDTDIHRMICEHHRNLQQLNERRLEIISGRIVPNEEDLYSNDEGEEDEPEGFVDSGIPDFWLQVLKCSGVTGELIQPYDEPILSKLRDIKVTMNEEEPRGFTLEFHFDTNDHFTNSVLTKTYYMKFEPDADDPFTYEGPYIYRSEGCVIDWKDGKNVTRKIVNKKQRHRTGNMTRVVTKEVKQESFFSIFSACQRSDSNSSTSSDSEEDDFDLGTFFKDKLVPRAVLYYSGEIEEDDMYEDDTESDD